MHDDGLHEARSNRHAIAMPGVGQSQLSALVTRWARPYILAPARPKTAGVATLPEKPDGFIF